MKTNPLLLTFCSVWLSTAFGFAGEANLFPPPSKSDGPLAVHPAKTTAIDSDDLAAALGIHHWNFQVQAADGMPAIRIAVRLIENGADRKLGEFTLSAEKWDSAAGKVIKGPKEFRVMVVVSPLDSATVQPLFESARFRVFAKEFQSGSTGAAIIENPFAKAPRRGIITYVAGQRGAAKVPRTDYDLYATDDYERVLRISFESGLPAEVK